ncbi:RNA-binding domain-containing protein [Annulohypoxylon truncatum]|uniref:RNA-binding domain-containing protein n=1 Tax=Annulohypoxylon truncatum TaxID=327061 RepID=UPI00200722EE|nr:RNA-binding domain-containing protein [Annulohypoxylon truncatum]KAI1211060.1 RNA-binding domain-containing protein [Annulohypoxylon truncatum]
MSYPPPPGPNSSLPPRPPPSRVSGFKPAFSPAPPPTHTPSPGAVTGAPYAPPAYSGAPVSHHSHHHHPPHHQYGGTSSYQQPYARPPSMSSGGGYQPPQPVAANPYQPYPGQQPQPGGGGYPSQQTPSYYGAQPQAAAPAPSTASYAAPPQIRNPFPAPAQARANDDYDPDMAAQIAQWQSAYVKDPAKEGPGAPGAAGAAGTGPASGGRAGAYANGATTTTTYSAESSAAAAAAAAVGANAAANPEKKKTVVRVGGGQKWTDDTLLEWDPSHLRLFVGNLAGETTDESLYKAFSQWKSLQKARVIRDKVTAKSKGYGFVSFSDPDEFFSAAKEMNGKYIQSHPVVVRKSTTEIKPTTQKDGNRWNKNGKNKNWKNKNRGGGGGGSGNGSGAGGKREGSFEPHLGPAAAGVHKPGQKTKGGLKLLG